MTVVGITTPGRRQETADRAPAAVARRGRVALGGGVPATFDLTRTLCSVVAIGTVTAVAGVIAPGRALTVSAWTIAALCLAIALLMLRAIATLAPPIPRTVRTGRRRPLRVAVVGSGAAATDLREELRRSGVESVAVVGAIVLTPRHAGAGHPLELGSLADVRRLVGVHAIDLLLVGASESRPRVLESVLRSCEGDPVRLCDFTEFYAAVFGRLPVSQTDRVWLQFVLHPRYRPRRLQRAFDLVVGGVLAALFLPLLGPLALLIRRDGGPALFRQVRIGQDGRRFVIYKLRTMRWEGEHGPERWSRDGDSRVTAIGRVLRRTHVDELPQLLSVLRGDMTLVGPRPEQPEIAARLEEMLPLWRGRYRHKPGLTGWAQVRCGYAGSHDGSAWKLAHDLYYLRHQSFALDVAVLAETLHTVLLHTVLRAPQFVDHGTSPFVRSRRGPGEAHAVLAGDARGDD